MNKTELTIQEIHTVTLNVLQTFHDYVKEKVFGITLPMEHCWGCSPSWIYSVG